jgi:uncharacterized heparinase superfamily protein
VLVDSGTYTYSADRRARQALRGTAAHNAVRVDGQDSSRLGIERWLWLIENDAHPLDVEWRSDDERDVLQAAHDGYRRLTEPVLHTRRIELDKRRMTWTIDDSLTGTGEHLVEVFFHPGVPFEVLEEGVRLRAPRGDVWLFPPAGASLKVEPGWISKGYGLREPSQVLVYAVRGRVPIHLRTEVVLVASGTSASAARCQVEARS